MAGQRGQYFGTTLQAIDAKGRIVIPASIRATIERNSADRELMMAPHPKAATLYAYDRGWADILDARVKDAERRALDAGQDFDMFRESRRAFGSMMVVPFDGGGRFTLPPKFRSRFGLGDLAVFVGVLDTFEIWHPQTLLDCDTVDADCKDDVRDLLAERGAA